MLLFLSQAPVQAVSPARTDKVLTYYATGFSWIDARSQCVKQGGDLATITSDQELSTLVSIIHTYANIWFGLNDFSTENTWVWSDGSNSTYRKWGVGESTGGTGENGALVYSGTNNGVFQDYPSVSIFPYFCSKCAQGTCMMVGCLLFFMYVYVRN
jgi:hypothetical protein